VTNKVNISTNLVDAVGAAVSARLKLFRRARGLTLDQLSRLSGVSKGMLVEAQRGAANPSIATLCKAAAALGVSVAEFVDVAAHDRPRIVKPEAEAVLWRGPLGGTGTLLAGTAGPDMIELWRWTLQPGERHESPPHAPGTIELIHVTEGRLRVVVEESAELIDAGGSALLRADAQHVYGNEHAGPVTYFMTVAELKQSPLGGVT